MNWVPFIAWIILVGGFIGWILVLRPGFGRDPRTGNHTSSSDPAGSDLFANNPTQSIDVDSGHHHGSQSGHDCSHHHHDSGGHHGGQDTGSFDSGGHSGHH